MGFESNENTESTGTPKAKTPEEMNEDPKTVNKDVLNEMKAEAKQDKLDDAMEPKNKVTSFHDRVNAEVAKIKKP